MNPTHRVIATGELVFPGGYDPEEIEALLEGYWEAAELAEAKDQKWAQIKRERDDRMLVATVQAGAFDIDERGRSNINGQVTAIIALGANAPSVTWRMHDNSFKDFTASEFVAAALSVSAYIGDVYAASWRIEAQIAAAQTVADVEAVTWPAG